MVVRRQHSENIEDHEMNMVLCKYMIEELGDEMMGKRLLESCTHHKALPAPLSRANSCIFSFGLYMENHGSLISEKKS